MLHHMKSSVQNQQIAFLSSCKTKPKYKINQTEHKYKAKETFRASVAVNYTLGQWKRLLYNNAILTMGLTL